MVSVTTSTTQILSLYRYAVKGLGPGDALPSVDFKSPQETFPDDRRYALIRDDKTDHFNPSTPQWLHKDHFLCAFTRPALLSTFHTSYQVVHNNPKGDVERLLTVWERSAMGMRMDPPLLGPVDLSTVKGREDVSRFFSAVSGEVVHCVTADDDGESSRRGLSAHRHQFGNTRSGVRQRGDTRTVHIVNAATVRQVSAAIGVPLRPERFRPNIVIDGGLEPWEEFDLVSQSSGEIKGGRAVACGGGLLKGNEVVLEVISKTVRCDGVSVDPYDIQREPLDVPGLLAKHFPEYGPFLGVYAVVKTPGCLEVGETFKVVKPPTLEMN